MEQKNEHFSIRKLTVGAASVLIGISFLGFNAHTVSADTTDNGSQANENVAKDSNVKSDEDKSSQPVTTLEVADQKAETSSEASADSAAQVQDLKIKETSAASDASELKIKSDAANSESNAVSVAKSEAASSASADSSAAKSAAEDEALKSMADKGAMVGKNEKGIYAALDATTPEAPKVTVQNVTDWSSFINALENANVDDINITHDITVTGKTGSLGGQSLGYNGCLKFNKENVARKVTITGNGNTVDFGHYSLMFQDANQKNGNGWDITIDDTKLKGVSKDGSGQTSATEPGQFGLISFADVNSDNQKKDTVTFNNVTANVEGRSVITGAGLNHNGEYYTLVLTGDNDVTASEDLKFQGASGSALDAGYVRIDNGTTNINVTSAYDGSNNYGGNAIRTAQTDIHNDDGSTVYTFDIKKDATLNITGGKDVRGIFAVDGVHGTANIDGTVKMDLGTGHSMAVFAGNLNVGKDGVLDVTTAYDATPDFGQIGRSISNFNGGQYGVLSIGVGNPTNLTNVDSNTINDDGIIRVKRTSTNEGMNPIISMGSGSSAVLKGTFTINVNQGATLDLQDSRQQTNLGMIFVSGSSANSNINIVNPKYVNLQRLNTPLPKNGSDLIYLEGGGQSGRTNGVHISNAPIAEWQAANTSTAPNYTWMVQSVNSMNNWGTNAGTGFTVAGQTSPQNKDGQEKFLYSNGNVIMAPSQSGTNSFEYNGSQTVNKNSNQGIITQGNGSQAYYTPYLNQFLNNYSYWTSQRLAMGTSLLNPDSPVKSKDNDLYEPEVQTISGTTKQTLNNLDPNKGIKDLQKASMDENGNWTTTTVPVDGIVKNVAWYTSADATEWANTMGGEDTPTNPEGNLKTTDTSAWAKVTYEDDSIDFVKIPLNITDKTNAETYTPSYKDTDVKRGSETTIPVTITDADGKTTTAPEGTKFVAGDFTAPEGVTVTVDPTSGAIKVTTKDNTPTGEFDIPVTVTYPGDNSTDNVTAKVTVTNSDADTYNPHYNPVNVKQGGKVETGVPSYGEGVTAPEENGKKTTYAIPEGTKLPESVTATIDPNTGNVTVTTSDNTPEGPIFVPVTVNYPDGSHETIDAPIAVGANTFIGTDYSVSVDTNLDNLHETTANSMNPDAKDAITKITWWNNNDVRAGKNLAGNVIYDKANGTGNLDDVTVEWTNPINTNVNKATMDEVLPGSNTSTVDIKNNPAIKITYGKNSQLIKDTGNGLFTTQGGSQTARWYGNGVIVEGAAPVSDAASKKLEVKPAKAGDALTDAEKALLDLTKLGNLTVNKPVSYTWANDLKAGETKGTVRITFQDKAKNGKATYLNVELPTGSLNVTDGTGNPTTPTDADKYDANGGNITVDKGHKLTDGDAEKGITNHTKLPEGTKYTWKDTDTPDTDTVGDKNGIVTVTYPDGSVDEVPVMVHVTDDADKYDPQGSTITIKKGDPAPDAEKGIKNPSELPTGTKYTWEVAPDPDKVGNQPVIVTVTYPDGSIDKVPATVIVTDDNNGKTTNPTDADKYDPEGQVVTVNKGDKLPDASNGISNTSDLPEGTNYTWKTPVDTTTSGDKPAIVVVTYPDGSSEDVPTVVHVNPTDADKYTPEGHNITVDKGSKVPDAETAITNNGDLPTGTNYTWKDTPDTNTIGDHPAIVVVTYPDGSQDNVPVIITVKDPNNKPENPTDADKYNPEGGTITVKKGDPVPDAENDIVNKNDLPTGTTYTWTDGTPTTTESGLTLHDITVTYPDGSKEIVPAYVNVVSDADNYTPVPEVVDTPQGQVPDPSEGIGNKGDLPDGTKYTWKDTPDVNTIGDHPAVVIVTYPDGSQDEVPTIIHVTEPSTPSIPDTPSTPVTPVTPSTPTDADTYTPIGQDITTPEGEVPDASQGIANKDQLPGGTTYTWQDSGKVADDVKKPGSHSEIIVVTYPDGSTDTVTVNVNVEPKSDDDSDKVPADNTKTTKTKKHAKHKKHSNTTDTAGIHSGNVNGENTSGVHSAGIGNGNGNHSSFYGNTGAKSEMDAKTLPQTGAQDNSLYGLIGLMFASLSAIIVLAGDKKRKN